MLSDKNSCGAICSWLNIETGQRPLKRKQILSIWIPPYTEHIRKIDTPKQHSVDVFQKTFNCVMISENYGLREMILILKEPSCRSACHCSAQKNVHLFLVEIGMYRELFQT